MGVNDAQEMLEAAQEECSRLEKELEGVKAERDKLVAEVTTVIEDLDRARANGSLYTYGNIQTRLRYALAAMLRVRVYMEKSRSDD